MDTLRNWLSPARREAIYTSAAALAPLLVTAGVILPGNVEPLLVIVAAVLQAAAGLLALINLKPTEAARWFGTVGRAVIYSGAVAVAGAVVAMGIVTQDWATTALTYTSFGLTFLASVLAVVTPKEVVLEPGDVKQVEAVVVNGAIVEPVVEVPVAQNADSVVEPQVEPATITIETERNG